jgi:hypothetical protein
MKISIWIFLIVGVCFASCINRQFNPESQVNGGGTGGDPLPDDLGSVDPNHYAFDELGRMITQNEDGSYNVRCNRGSDERQISATLLDSGEYCIQEKNDAVSDQPSSSSDNPWDPTRYPSSPAYFKGYQGRVVGRNLNNTECSIETTPDRTGFSLVVNYSYNGVDYKETIHSSKFALPTRINSLTASGNTPLSVSRIYTIGLDRYGEWLFLTSRAFSGGKLECRNLKRAAQ